MLPKMELASFTDSVFFEWTIGEAALSPPFPFNDGFAFVRAALADVFTDGDSARVGFDKLELGLSN